MCGIIGYSGKEKFNVTRIKTLIMWNALLRGVDSTGLYSPINGLKKSLESGDDFIVNEKNTIKPDTLFMGHVRAATVGSKDNVNNSHPFKRNNYYLIHNGTLTNHWDLANKNGLNFNGYNVDSEIIAGCIAKNNNFDVLSEIDGAGAFIIIDENLPNVMYVFRNKERPLFKGFIDGNMYISSEDNALKFIGCINIKEFKEDILYTIEDASIINEKKIKNVPFHYPKKIAEVNKLIDIQWCWLRALHKCTFKLNKSTFTLFPNQYYLVEKVINKKTVSVYCPTLDSTHNVPLTLLDEDDILEKGDLAVMMKDTTVETKFNGTAVIQKGEFVKIGYVFGDADVSILNKDTGNFICHVKKSHVRRSTLDEWNKELKSKYDINKTLPIPFLAPDMMGEDDYSIEQEVNDIITGDESKDFDNAHNPDFDVIIKSNDIIDFFEVLNKNLEELNELVNKETLNSTVRDKILHIIAINETSQDHFMLNAEPIN